ncbi:MAG: ImmA/IrrE family metallo-endopeptidase [Candidatus Thiodiazotropha sp.]|nr:ImmA/IrrE family metallo-endopeptidase [Candidatus Thiodiazotropha sp.]
MRTIESIIEMAENLAGVHRGKEFMGGDPYVAFQESEVPVHELEFQELFDGMLRYERGRFHTFINTGKGCSPGRQRFTTGHEFGHYTIEHHREGVRTGTMLHPSVTGFKSKQAYEREADTFAAHFLMPTQELLRYCRRSKSDWGAEQILEVSDTFGTSLASSARRCVEVLPGDSLLYVWSGSNVHWVIGGGEWKKHERARRVKSHTDLVPDSATSRVLVNPIAGAPIKKGSTLGRWSTSVWPDTDRDPLVLEYAIPRGRFGPMTLLRPAE